MDGIHTYRPHARSPSHSPIRDECGVVGPAPVSGGGRAGHAPAAPGRAGKVTEESDAPINSTRLVKH